LSQSTGKPAELLLPWLQLTRRTTMENAPIGKRRHKGILGPVILILVGTVFFLEKTGAIQREMLSQWWPLLLVFIGGWLLVTRLNRNK
jgi:hypothetical protein